MDHTSRSSSGGGGGRLSQTWLSGGSPEAAHDEGRPPRTPELMDGRPPSLLPVLPLDQIKVTGSSNEYTEGPAAAPERRRPQSEPATATSRTGELPETSEERPSSLRELPPAEDGVIVAQPKRAVLVSEELKPLNKHPRPAAAVTLAGSKAQDARSTCKDCRGCCRPCALPSCRGCEERFLCSAEKVVDCVTCVCCIKGLFYHCSSDDEDTSTDRPFSCRQPHCCARWAAASLLSLLFPCILCYLPARCCLAVCESCDD